MLLNSSENKNICDHRTASSSAVHCTTVPPYGTNTGFFETVTVPAQSSVVGGVGIDDKPHLPDVGKKADGPQFITGGVESSVTSTVCVQVAVSKPRVAVHVTVVAPGENVLGALFVTTVSRGQPVVA